MMGQTTLTRRYRAPQGAGLGMLCMAAVEAPRKVPGPARIVAGQILPWDTPGRPTGYPGLVTFQRGSIDLESVAGAPLLLDHDPTRPIGRATGLIDRPSDLAAAFRIAATSMGDDALTLVAAGVRDGFSIGAVVDEYDLGDEDAQGIPELLVTAGHVRETSLLTFPAYATAGCPARPLKGTQPMTDQPTPAVTFSEVDGVPIATVAAAEQAPPPAQVPTSAAPAPALPQAPAPAPALDVTPELVAQLAAALTAQGPSQAPPAVPVAVVASEALDYLRAGAPHSFVRDGFAVRESHDVDARNRLSRFARQVEAGALHQGQPFANEVISQALVQAANEPTRAGQPSLIAPGYRPDLYVDQLQFPRPLVEAVAQAPISDATPFTVPRFVSATNLSQDVATEGVNPAPGVIATELVTVTPKAVSGIYDASRELVDSSGGGVAIDTIALAAMRESWAQQTENRLATELKAAGNGTDVALGASPTSLVALTAIIKEIIALANRRKAPPTRVLADAVAYSALASANATDGRPLLPWSAYTTSNVAGRTEAVLGANVMGVGMELAWALSLVIVILERGSVYNFESPAQTFTFPEVIGPAQVRFAIFGYQACRVLRPAGVSRLTYTGTPAGFELGSLADDVDTSEGPADKATPKGK